MRTAVLLAMEAVMGIWTWISRDLAYERLRFAEMFDYA
jgi:hypothetical protein